MDINKVFEVMEKNNIEQDQIFELVKEAKSLDLKNEDDIRLLIRKGSNLANKEIDEYKESQIIELIKDKGITPELLDLL